MEPQVQRQAQEMEIQKIIVAVHGIGDQTRFVTIKQVLEQFSRYHGFTAAVPLGNFYTSGDAAAFIPTDPELKGLAFTEVYWADIPREMVEKKYVLEDVKPWVRTIIGRVYRRQWTARPLTDADARRIQQVLGEMLETIDVLGRLCFLAEKMGIFSFDLKKVLLDFVDDVQVVAEFKQQGGEIGSIFAEQMRAVYKQFKEPPEIYIFAHSEGTVVAFLGLLTAICSQEDPWISRVRGFMTFGSPIDKHLVLWPELFANFKKPCSIPAQPIQWHNYYDYGDPVGFELETARCDFTHGDWEGIFDFPAKNDHGFARYPLPGKAHTDYWQDAAVFDHFIGNVVYAKKDDAPPSKQAPGSKFSSKVISWTVPYLLAMALLFCAVLVLYKAVHGFVSPAPPPGEPGGLGHIFYPVAAITSLLAGITVMARIPRLTLAWGWRAFGAFFFLLSIAAYLALHARDGGSDNVWQVTAPLTATEGLGLVGVATVLVLGITVLGTLFPAWGMKTLLIPGTLAVGYVVYEHIQNAHGNLWPVFVAGAVFLYLWWLVALLFDLTFVWHRYIRSSVPIFQRQVATRRR